jgi:hypothetical protein
VSNYWEEGDWLLLSCLLPLSSGRRGEEEEELPMGQQLLPTERGNEKA